MLLFLRWPGALSDRMSVFRTSACMPKLRRQLLDMARSTHERQRSATRSEFLRPRSTDSYRVLTAWSLSRPTSATSQSDSARTHSGVAERKTRCVQTAVSFETCRFDSCPRNHACVAEFGIRAGLRCRWGSSPRRFESSRMHNARLAQLEGGNRFKIDSVSVRIRGRVPCTSGGMAYALARGASVFGRESSSLSLCTNRRDGGTVYARSSNLRVFGRASSTLALDTGEWRKRKTRRL